MTQNCNAYRVTQAYRGASTTVAPLTAVVMLLDGAILYLKKTIEAAEAKRFEESHAHLVRATSILRGLSHHLNFEKGGPLADTVVQDLQLHHHGQFDQPSGSPDSDTDDTTS